MGLFSAKRAEEKELLLLKGQPVDLVLRPWIGYEEVELRNIRVESMDQLMKEAKEYLALRSKRKQFVKEQKSGDAVAAGAGD